MLILIKISLSIVKTKEVTKKRSKQLGIRKSGSDFNIARLHSNENLLLNAETE